MNSSDIARLAGVSRSTVSRVINNYGDISEQTRQKVMAVIKENNYVPNAFGQGLAGKSTHIIGLFIIDRDNTSEDNLIISRSEVFATFVSYTTDIAHNLGYNILLSIIDSRHLGDIQRLFMNKSICAGLVIGDTFDQEILDSLAQMDCKIALHNQREHSDIPNIINVNVDNQHFGYLAAEQLLKHGHYKIGFVTGNFHKFTVQQRYLGFTKALSEKGVTHDQKLIGVGDFHRADGGYAATKQILERSAPDYPTALVISNSVMIPGVLQALKEIKLRIPEDISVVSIGGSASSSSSNPPITDLYIDNQRIASVMISKVTQLLDIGELNQYNFLLKEYDFVQRGSVRNIITTA